MSDNTNQTDTKPVDVYSLVTNRIIELLEAGTVPWRKPWTGKGIPMNAISKRPYRGINMMLLNSYDYPHNHFLTWKQIKTIGGSVLKGEKGIFVVFTKMIEKEVDKNGKMEKERKSMLRYYKVFNLGQCKDIPVEFMPKEDGKDLEPVLECSAIMEGMKDAPKVVHKKGEAFYVPSEDYINMPRMKTFKTVEDYYGVLFHELIHSTGHQSRLSRKEVYENNAFGSVPYSLEELVAEIGSCFLKSYSGLPIADMANNAAYIKGWLEVFKGDKRILIKAASRSQQAVEYILNPKVEEGQKPEEEDVMEVEGVEVL
jgi:antirestriction protein ArdC